MDVKKPRFTSHTPSFLLPPAHILVLVMCRYPLCMALHLSLLTIGRSTAFSTSSSPVPGKVSVFHVKSSGADCFCSNAFHIWSFLNIVFKKSQFQSRDMIRVAVPLVSPQPYILHNFPSGMEHPATGSWIVWTLSAGRAGLQTFDEERR